jgi:hypothetical protein
MPRICYASKNFTSSSLEAIEQANTIIAEYAAQGFDLTLRQLYYQHVARGLIPNTLQSYKRLGSIINDARLAGLIDWDSIVDRTRSLRSLAHWDDPAGIVDACASQFRVDKWEGQEFRPEVWIEKDALVGVIEDVCNRLDVPYFSCRGYTSQSEMWTAARRLMRYAGDDQTPFIIHLGDHDPSGIDMTRDITDRVMMFMEHHDYDPANVRRLALNMDQVDQYDPPPNPAKITDSRARNYMATYGHESWELDALEPSVMATLIEDAITEVREETLWEEKVAEELRGRERLQLIADNWANVQDFLEDMDEPDDEEDDE